ncbi:hypothetical protein [Fulvivirga sediminis]|uniref:Uncharacterized protein n=1 Tax=Fulvivirga sediminis TaxID=2803949 RepID=A0A937F902_9BACT|nr:hypothetical protein [Fulvivirga sediminis]MBL3656475.1 hypothetical protein [Fulvivirga sediminis]
MTNKELDYTLQLVNKDLSLEKNTLPESVNNFDEIREKLIPVIKYLLNKDFNRLLTSLYRIDVDEHKVKEVISLETPDQLASSLTDLILQRELQKAVTRIKYQS